MKHSRPFAMLLLVILTTNVDSFIWNRSVSAGSLAVSISSFGALCDSQTVDNQAFQRAFEHSLDISVPEGTCVVDDFDLPAGASVIGVKGKSRIVPGPSGRAFLFIGRPSAKKAGLHIAKLSFSPNSFSGSKHRVQYAITVESAINIQVEECLATDIELLTTNKSLEYRDASLSAQVQHVGFYSNECIGDGFVGACAEFRYVDGVVANKNHINGYRDGIYYWGGDSNLQGQLGSPRWAHDITFSENAVENVSGAAIWGSMGDGVRLIGNQVRNVGDVGIDFEGTIHGIATGNYCINAKNGCGSTFFINQSVAFVGNVFTQTDAREPLIRIYNVALDKANSDITVANNSLKCGDRVVTCVADDLKGPADRITFRNNTMQETRIALTSTNAGQITVADNFLDFDRHLDSPAISIQSFGATSTISRNTVRSSVLQQESPAIRVLNSDFNHSNEYVIKGNIVDKFKVALTLHANGKNKGTAVKYLICNNLLNGGEIIKQFGDALQSVTVAINHDSCPSE